MSNRYIAPALLCIFFANQSTTFAQHESRSGYQLAWSDEFEGNSLDASKWTASNTNNTTNQSLQDYLPSQVSVENGFLKIKSENIPSRGLPYRSGLVRSVVARQYGRYEIRAKLPTSKGMWPAIWLLPNTSQHPWPRQGEIDIMENRGDQWWLTSSAYHWGTNPPFNHSFVYSEQVSYKHGHVNYHNSFHTYACEWEPDQIRFYVDGEHHYTVYDTMTDGFISQQTAPMNLIINTAIGGTFLDNPDDTTIWPQTLEVDYVKVFEKVAPPVLGVNNGSFEVNNGSLAFWKTFGKNEFPNVQAHPEYVQNGTTSCKLFGQFNGETNYSGIEQGMSVEPGTRITAKANAFTPNGDSVANTNNQCLLKIDFYSKPYGAFGSKDYISSGSVVLMERGSQENTWVRKSITEIVPSGAQEARVAIVFAQSDNHPGAVFVDNVSLAKPKVLKNLPQQNQLEPPR